MLNPIFWNKVQGQKHPGRWGIVEHQIPSIKVLFKTNTKSHKHPGIKLLSSESKAQLVNQGKQKHIPALPTHVEYWPRYNGTAVYKTNITWGSTMLANLFSIFHHGAKFRVIQSTQSIMKLLTSQGVGFAFLVPLVVYYIRTVSNLTRIL